MNVLIFFVIKIIEYRSMLWSLRIIFILVLKLFAGKFKSKIDTYIFRFKTFVFFTV